MDRVKGEASDDSRSGDPLADREAQQQQVDERPVKSQSKARPFQQPALVMSDTQVATNQTQ
jgi:hypothetical protein